jgi:hypothetical protein
VIDSASVPGFRIIRPLGEGGMASVYLAVQESLDREVALKVMAPHLAANKEFTDRFLKEGRITAKLSHPNLVTVFDIGQAGTVYYLAAEYIPGGTLRDRMNRGISIAESLDVMRDVAHGLQYAHEMGFVHRDVKPGNVLFRANGSAVLADFGIAKAVDQKTMATQIGSSIGTPHYMSPEQARAEKVDARSDLYSLGAMFHELLTGAPPYDADDPFTIALMHVTHPVPELSAELRWLQPLLSGLMAKRADERFASGDEFVLALDKLLASAPEAQRLAEGEASLRKRAAPRLSRTATPAPRVGTEASTAVLTSGEPSGDKRKLMLGGGIAAAALLAVIGVWMMTRGDEAVVAPAPVAQVDPGATTTLSSSPANEPGTAEPTAAMPEEPPADALSRAAGDPERLLDLAERYVAIGMTQGGRRLSAPPGDNALDIYLQVLSIDPQNAEARAGLQRIGAFFESKAKAAFDRGAWNFALVLAEQGLQADPANRELQRIATEARKELDEAPAS